MMISWGWGGGWIEVEVSILSCNVSAYLQDLWADLYLRWSQDNSTQQDTIKQIISIKEHNKELRTKVIRMRRFVL